MAKIKAISYYLPEGRLTNEKLHDQFPEWSVEKISSKTGISQRSICSEDEFSSDMAVNSAEKLFSENNIDRNDIDFVLLCTQSPDYFLPTTACLVQNRLGLKKSTGALDFNLGCSGYVYGLGLAKGLVDTDLAKNILLITAESYSKFIHLKDKSNRTIFGDAASATLITKNEGLCSIDSFIFGTDGEGANNLIVKNGGLRNRSTNQAFEFMDEQGNTHNDNHLYMNGPEIFNFTLEIVPKLTKDVLEKANLKIEDVTTFLFHQANQYLLNHLRNKINIPENKFIIHLGDFGNTVSSTIPIALHYAIQHKKYKSGDKILLAGFGVGYSWSGCMLNF